MSSGRKYRVVSSRGRVTYKGGPPDKVYVGVIDCEIYDFLMNMWYNQEHGFSKRDAEEFCASFQPRGAYLERPFDEEVELAKIRCQILNLGHGPNFEAMSRDAGHAFALFEKRRRFELSTRRFVSEYANDRESRLSKEKQTLIEFGQTINHGVGNASGDALQLATASEDPGPKQSFFKPRFSTRKPIRTPKH